MRYVSIIILSLLFLISCGSAKNVKALVEKEQQYIELKSIVEAKNFAFSAETLYPMLSNAMLQVNNTLMRNTGNSAGRIDINGNGDFINIKGDSIQGNLAYYGEVRIVSSLNPRDSGIQFNGVPSTYEVTENDLKQRIRIKFKINSNTERYEIALDLFPNKRASVFINCINRTPIKYDGKLVEIMDAAPTSK